MNTNKEITELRYKLRSSILSLTESLNVYNSIFGTYHKQKKCLQSISKYLNFFDDDINTEIYPEYIVNKLCDYLSSPKDCFLFVAIKKGKQSFLMDDGKPVINIYLKALCWSDSRCVPKMSDLLLFRSSNDIKKHLINLVSWIKNENELELNIYADILLEIFILAGKWFFLSFLDLYPNHIKLKAWYRILIKREYLLYNIYWNPRNTKDKIKRAKIRHCLFRYYIRIAAFSYSESLFMDEDL